MKGFPGMRGGFPGNLNKLMKQAKKMQQQMEEERATLEAKDYEGSAGGGVVTCTVNGRFELKSVAIKPEAVDPDDVEMLQDLVVAAVNDAMRKARDEQDSMMQGLTGGLDLPF